MRNCKWLWGGWIAQGKLNLLAGEPSAGKTTIAMSIAATVSTGGDWPDGTKAKAGGVLIWSSEDDPEDTLAPRLKAAGANLERIAFISGVHTGRGSPKPFDPSSDFSNLKNALADRRDVALVVVDPIVHAVQGSGNDALDVRRGLQPIVDFAKDHKCAVVGITHFAKDKMGRSPLERIIGSGAFGAVARVTLIASKNRSPSIDADRLLIRAKANSAAEDGGAFAYSLSGRVFEANGARIQSSTVDWGARISGDAATLLATATKVTEDEQQVGALDEAKECLLELLKDGPMRASEALERAISSGHSRATVYRASKDLAIAQIRTGKESTWRLPSVSTQLSVSDLISHAPTKQETET